MKQLETVMLRAFDSKKRDAALELLREMAAKEKPKAPAVIMIFRHTTLENDISLHLLREGEFEAPEKSVLGLKAAHMLHDFGSVNHALWLESTLIPNA